MLDVVMAQKTHNQGVRFNSSTTTPQQFHESSSPGPTVPPQFHNSSSTVPQQFQPRSYNSSTVTAWVPQFHNNSATVPEQPPSRLHPLRPRNCIEYPFLYYPIIPTGATKTSMIKHLTTIVLHSDLHCGIVCALVHPASAYSCAYLSGWRGVCFAKATFMAFATASAFPACGLTCHPPIAFNGGRSEECWSRSVQLHALHRIIWRVPGCVYKGGMIQIKQ